MNSKIAKALATVMHRGHKYNGGTYIDEHVAKVVAETLKLAPDAPDDLISIAWLHDTVEDTALTIADLESLGFYPMVLVGVELLTRPKDMEYATYVKRASYLPSTRVVKMADLTVNLDSDPRPSLRARYEKAFAFLYEIHSENKP